jgi:pimeloyl-ACP methyl ester carboxylesterase
VRVAVLGDSSVRKLRRTILLVLCLLVAALLIGPFLVPVPPLEQAVQPEQLADPDSLFLKVNGLQVHYKTTGDGEPTLILLHGFGASIFSWREVMTPLGEQGTVVAFDRPAFGLTERPLTWQEGANPYTPGAHVALVVGLMDALGVDAAVLVGNSAGGTVAANTALTRPERVAALVLVDAAIYEGGGAPAWIRPLLRTPQLDHLGPLLARQIAVRGDAFLESAWHDPSLITPEIRAGYRKPLRAENWDRALWNLTKASRQSDLSTRLEEIHVPSLVITGDDDRIVPTEQSVRLGREIPDAELVVIPDCGHVPQEECPGPFLHAVEVFLGELPSY